MKQLFVLASKLLFAFAIALSLFQISKPALALDLDPDEIRGKSSKEPLTVLQNRYFLKSTRPEVGFVVGSILDEAYLNTTTFGMRAGFFANEWLGCEVQMLRTNVSDSDDRRALNQLKYRPLKDDKSDTSVPTDGTETEVVVTPDPEINAIHGMTDFHAVVAPFYGKLNFMNKWIVYTDMYVTAGLARVETDQGDKNSVTLGAGERFYVGKSWSFRFDFKDRIFNETRAGQTTRKNSYSFDFGASYFFN
jgi:outer membrane beta-barrel protein